jgi:hypothetical protein
MAAFDPLGAICGASMPNPRTPIAPRQMAFTSFSPNAAAITIQTAYHRYYLSDPELCHRIAPSTFENFFVEFWTVLRNNRADAQSRRSKECCKNHEAFLTFWHEVNTRFDDSLGIHMQGAKDTIQTLIHNSLDNG